MSQATLEQPLPRPAAPAMQYLTFTLGAEEYAVDILKVQEIRGYESVTRIAGAPVWMKGVINLRGAIVPIVDLRLRFALGEARYDRFTVVIVLNVAQRVVGIVVDGVSEVIGLSADQIQPAPEVGGSLEASHITGLATAGERMIILLDIERLIDSHDMGPIDGPEELSRRQR